MILLDTHVVVWLALEPARISKKARAVIEETRQHGQGLAISDISLLEIAILQSKGRIKLTGSLETFLEEIEARFIVLPITGQICAAAVTPPPGCPKDPADRIIVASALVRGVSLVTADNEIWRVKTLSAIW